MHPYEAQPVKPISNAQAYTLRQAHHIYQPDQFAQQGHHIQYQQLRNNNNNNSNNSNGGPLLHEHSPGGKRKPHRGNRSVNTLSDAQLERKRANDREAQRAIRQRTKEQIENLQKRVAELSIHEGACAELLATSKRNKELEEENLLLRSKLGQAINTLRRNDSADPVFSPSISTTGEVYNSKQADPSMRNFYQHRSLSASTVASGASGAAMTIPSHASSASGPGPNRWNLTSFQTHMPSLNHQFNNDNYDSRLSPSPTNISSGTSEEVRLPWATTQETNRSQSLSDIYNAATQGSRLSYWTNTNGQQTIEYVNTTTADRSASYEPSPAPGSRVLIPRSVSDVSSCLPSAVPIGYKQTEEQQQQQQQQQEQQQQQAGLNNLAQHPRNGSAGAVQAIDPYSMIDGYEGFVPTTSSSASISASVPVSSAQQGAVTMGAVPIRGLNNRQYLYEMAVQPQD